jgi:hypothetical protein
VREWSCAAPGGHTPVRSTTPHLTHTHRCAPPWRGIRPSPPPAARRGVVQDVNTHGLVNDSCLWHRCKATGPDGKPCAQTWKHSPGMGTSTPARHLRLYHTDETSASFMPKAAVQSTIPYPAKGVFPTVRMRMGCPHTPSGKTDQPFHILTTLCYDAA